MVLRAAICHSSPIFLSSQHTTQKCLHLISLAAAQSSNLIVFPESYIPAFPLWSSLFPPTQNHHLFEKMAEESILVDGPEMMAIRDLARKEKVTVSLGFSERVRWSKGCLYNSNVILGSDGEVRVHHRKLMPTWFEKLTWSPGDGYGLRTTPVLGKPSSADEPGPILGQLGALICGENTNPLARYALMAKCENIHISSWPAIWPTRVPSLSSTSSSTKKPSTTIQNDDGKEAREGKNYDNVAANRTRAAAHCFEAKAFGILRPGHLSPEMIAFLSAESTSPSQTRQFLESSPRGASMFLDPTGALKEGWINDEKTGGKVPKEMLQLEEGILYGDLDVREVVEGKQYHDLVGGYQRLDVFEVKVDRRRREPCSFVD